MFSSRFDGNVYFFDMFAENDIFCHSIMDNRYRSYKSGVKKIRNTLIRGAMNMENIAKGVKNNDIGDDIDKEKLQFVYREFAKIVRRKILECKTVESKLKVR